MQLMTEAPRSKKSKRREKVQQENVAKPARPRNRVPLTVERRVKALALQIRESQDTDWSTLNRVDFNDDTPPEVRQELETYLEDLRFGWASSLYFEVNSAYRIVPVYH